MNFKDFLDLESGETNWSESKLKWKRDLHGEKVPHRELQWLECDNSEIYKQGEVSLRKSSFEGEIARACESCLKRITQIKYYTTENTKLKRLPENEIGYMLPLFERDSE